MGGSGSVKGFGEFQSNAGVLTGSFLGILVGIHSIYSYSMGVFIKPIEAEFGLSRAQASYAATLSLLCLGILSPIAGHLLDRYGSRSVAAVSLVSLTIGFSLLGLLTQGLWSFVLLSLLLCVMSIGSASFTFSRLIVANFVAHRGLALGIVLTATGVGAAVFPYLLMPFIATYGWRNGYFALSILVLAVTPIVLFLIWREESERKQTAESISYGAVLKDPAFFVLATFFLISAIAVLGTMVHFIAMLSDAGISAGVAGFTASLIGWGAIAARILMGWLLDIFSPPKVAASFFAVAAAGMFAIGIGGMEYAVLGALLVGVAIGAEGDLIAFMVARYFPLKSYGTVIGCILFFFGMGAALGPTIAGYLKDTTGDYRKWLIFSTFCLLISSALALALLRLPLAADQRAWSIFRHRARKTGEG